MIGFTFAPIGWLLCNGSLLSIAEYQILYTLIGTTYGGDGVTTFGIPDLRSRVSVHQNPGSYIVGQTGGAEQVTITSSSYPSHTHPLLESTSTTTPVGNPAGNAAAPLQFYSSSSPADAMNNAMIGNASGGSQPHSNLQPFQVINWIIATDGIWPAQS